MAVGIAVIVLSGVATAAATGWWSLFAAVAIFGLGGPLISVGTPALVSEWFTGDDRGPATGVAVTGPVVGSVLSLLLANAVFMPLTGDRWRAVVLIHAGFAAFAGLVWLVVTSRPPEIVGRSNPWRAAAPEHRAGSRALLRVPIVRIVLVLAIGTFFVNHSMGSWLPEMLRASGLSAASAGAWAAVASMLGLFGGIVVPRLAVEGRRRAVLVSCYGILAIGVFSLMGPWSTSTIVGLVCIGLMRSAVLPVAMLFLMDSPDVGPANMSAAGALYFTAGELGGVAGPLTVGLLASSSGFSTARLVLAGVAVGLGTVAALGPGLGRRLGGTLNAPECGSALLISQVVAR